jgi:hypothetical protein
MATQMRDVPAKYQAAMNQMMTPAKEVAKCPMPTQDVVLNLKNRAKAITTAAYGPENPALPNTAYWKRMADEWDVSIEDAKKSRCGNCAAFNVQDSIKQCIAKGIGNEADPWGTIRLADLGYCEIFDFKCAANRTCRAWVVGGPNTGENQDKDESLDEMNQADED